MIISIFGTNGMLSTYLSIYFIQRDNVILNLYGIEEPKDYRYNSFVYVNLLEDEIDYNILVKSDIIIYAAGAGVQAAVDTKSDLMYNLNLFIPIKICNKLKEHNYKGTYISFGSYMEIGLNDNENILFSEKQIELSPLQVTNDYALSKRLLTRYMGNLIAGFKYWHFILPNMFVKNEAGTRLIPFVLGYIKSVKNGELIDLPKFSSGNQIRQYINLEELCIVLSKSLEYDMRSGIYNVGGGDIFTIKELITRLFNFYDLLVADEMFGQEVRRDGDIMCLKIDGAKLENEIKYLPNQRIESIL